MPQAYVLGSPIAHSLSPVLHRAAYAALGLTDWSYAARRVDTAGFRDFVAGCGPQVRGLSLTMPLKEAAFTLADPISSRARQAGAINTLVRLPSGGWRGENTDIAGIIAALGGAQAAGSGELGGGLILGAGATARSALMALSELGCTQVTVCARDPEKAGRSLAALAIALDVSLTVRSLARWPQVIAPRSLSTLGMSSTLAISTLPPPGAHEAAVTLTAGSTDLSGVCLLDVVYAHWPTPLAQAAAAHGASVVSGLDMLVHQAVEQVELMTGRRPDWRVLLTAGHAALAAG